MMFQGKTRTAFVILIGTLLVGGLITSRAFAQRSCCSKKKSGASGKAGCHDASQVRERADPPFRAPHGGQLSRTTFNYFEVVYGPGETRLYVYDMFRYPEPTRGIVGEAIMQVPSNGETYHYPLHHVSASDGQDYLAVRVDLTGVRDGDMDVQFEVRNLPFREFPTARFTQVFARPQQTMVVAPRQVAGQQQPKATEGTAPQPTEPIVVVTEATGADQVAVKRQQICPVTDSPLGEHGTPLKMTIDGRSLFVCCQGCIQKVQANPQLYLATVRR